MSAGRKVLTADRTQGLAAVLGSAGGSLLSVCSSQYSLNEARSELSIQLSGRRSKAAPAARVGIGGGPPVRGEPGKVPEIDHRIAVEIPRGNVLEGKRLQELLRTDDRDGVTIGGVTGQIMTIKLDSAIPDLLGVIIDDEPIARIGGVTTSNVGADIIAEVKTDRVIVHPIHHGRVCAGRVETGILVRRDLNLVVGPWKDVGEPPAAERAIQGIVPRKLQVATPFIRSIRADDQGQSRADHDVAIHIRLIRIDRRQRRLAVILVHRDPDFGRRHWRQQTGKGQHKELLHRASLQRFFLRS